MSMTPTASILVVTLLVAVALGVIAAVVTADSSSAQWAPQAAQILVTLLVAAAVEQKTLPNEVLGWVGVVLGTVIVVGVGAALWVSIDAGAHDRGLTSFECGVVNGSIAAVTVTVLASFVYRLWPDPPQHAEPNESPRAHQG